MITLEDGKTYLTREGAKVTVHRLPQPIGIWEFHGDGEYWRGDGKWDREGEETSHDIMEEVVHPSDSIDAARKFCKTKSPDDFLKMARALGVDPVTGDKL